MKLISLILLFTFVGCARNGPHLPVEGAGSQVEGQSGGGAVGYAEVEKVFSTYCSACHPSQSKPNWLDFNQAREYALNGQLLRRVVIEKSMPKSGSPQAAKMTDHDRGLIGQWVRGGAPMEAANPAPSSNSGATILSGGQGTSDIPPTARSCVQCHALDLKDDKSKTPRLVGQNEQYIEDQLRQFAWDKRQDPTRNMNDVAAGLDDEQIIEVAKFFSTRKVPTVLPRRTALATASFERGRALAVSACTSCHMNPSMSGGTNRPYIPLLAGQNRRYLINQLIWFQNNSYRHNPEMRDYLRAMSDQDLEDIAVYFSLSR